MSSEIGFAIVGVGIIADFHARAIGLVPGARLIAACSRSVEKTKEFATRHQIEAMTSLEALLQRKDVDVVCVATPSGTHAEIAIPCLNAGKHVLCEKPLDIRLDRIDAMIAAAKTDGSGWICIICCLKRGISFLTMFFLSTATTFFLIS